MVRDTVVEHEASWSENRTSPIDVADGLHSYSGSEPNSVFHNTTGHRFVDVSGLSGLDAIGDLRAIVQLDVDRDGRPDFAFANANKPLFQLFRNEQQATGGVIAIRLVGGAREARPGSKWSNRDAIGARVRLTMPGGSIRVRELRCGEGLASQNSATLLFGLGSHQRADVEVAWPSGKRTRVAGVGAGALLTIHENPKMGPGGVASRSEPYRLDLRLSSRRKARATLTNVVGSADGPRIYVTMATWCHACRAAAPQVAAVARRFGPQTAVFGVPIDPADDQSMLDDYVRKHRPAYRMLPRLSAAAHRAFVSVLGEGRGSPSTIVVDRRGQVLRVFDGVPSMSALADAIADRN